ncbi:MAG: hypothetical protein A3J74_01295 [Elusimicrobia bacterium RIFCSPHIGHO2_02_FULL_57_9]|nr:MAG: hypothetical protein A3J74_01295 [Elusimicrobia bacterium RIFCSPHIGHO2_02_FULL_57_9]
MTGYKTVLELQVRFRDTDAMGHINNAVYLSYLELARLEYLRRVYGITESKDFGIILARVEIDYKSPGYLRDRIDIGVRVSSLGGASFEMVYRVEERTSGRLIAEAKTIQVSYDYAAGKVRRLTPEYIKKAKEYDGLA